MKTKAEIQEAISELEKRIMSLSARVNEKEQYLQMCYAQVEMLQKKSDSLKEQIRNHKDMLDVFDLSIKALKNYMKNIK